MIDQTGLVQTGHLFFVSHQIRDHFFLSVKERKLVMSHHQTRKKNTHATTDVNDEIDAKRLRAETRADCARNAYVSTLRAGGSKEDATHAARQAAGRGGGGARGGDTA